MAYGAFFLPFYFPQRRHRRCRNCNGIDFREKRPPLRIPIPLHCNLILLAPLLFVNTKVQILYIELETVYFAKTVFCTLHKNCFIDIFNQGLESPKLGAEGGLPYSCCLIRFVPSLRSVPPSAAARRTLQRDCKKFEKMQEMFVPCPCVVGMIALYAPTL